MKSNAIKFSAILMVCFFSMISFSSFAQNNSSSNTGGNAKAPQTVDVKATGRPGTNPNSKTYSTQSDFVLMMVTNGKEGDIVKFRVEFDGKSEDKEIKIDRGQTSASSSICHEQTRGIKVSWSATNANVRVNFKDTADCSEGRKAAPAAKARKAAPAQKVKK